MLDHAVFEALNNPGNSKIIPGTDRISKVLSLLSNPQNKCKSIHITGTNGKGSTAAFIETGLIHAGFRVGKFTSPHIKVINESICLNGSVISDEDLTSNFWLVFEIAKSHNIELSPFELLTAIMFNHFATIGIDYLVLEVGMGGQDDSTNVVDSIVSIITNISLEHTKFLGNTLSDIAYAKSGIIKNGLTIIADNTKELTDAVTQKTNNFVNVFKEYKFDCKLDYTNFKTILSIHLDTELTFNLNLFGKFQAYNFLVAYHCLKYLGVSLQSIQYAAENTKNIGRFEIREYNPLVIFDATHNLAGAKSLVADLRGVYNPNDVVIITSIMQDKDIAGMFLELAKIANTIICTKIPDNPRAIPEVELGQIAKKYFSQVHTTTFNSKNALEIAKAMNKSVVLITGSFYLLKSLY